MPRQLAPFDWNFLWIGTLRAKDLRKNVPVLQEEGSTPDLSRPGGASLKVTLTPVPFKNWQFCNLFGLFSNYISKFVRPSVTLHPYTPPGALLKSLSHLYQRRCPPRTHFLYRFSKHVRVLAAATSLLWRMSSCVLTEQL